MLKYSKTRTFERKLYNHILIYIVWSLTANRLDYFIVGVTNSTDLPVIGAYPLCGQYPSTVALGAAVTLYCIPRTSTGLYVIIQQPRTGTGLLTLCEVEVYAGTVGNCKCFALL